MKSIEQNKTKQDLLLIVDGWGGSDQGVLEGGDEFGGRGLLMNAGQSSPVVDVLLLQLKSTSIH